MKPIKLTILGRRVYVALSKSWKGFDVGLFHTRVSYNPVIGSAKARSIVIWRISVFIELK